jgi:hypothetical protein
MDTLDNKNSSSDTVSTSDSSVVASNISVEVDGTLIPQGVHECDIDLSTESIQQNSIDRNKPSVQDRKARWTNVMEKQKIKFKEILKTVTFFSAWMFIQHKAQLKRYQEISLISNTWKVWKKSLHQTYFRGRMRYKQTMFWIDAMQINTGVMQKRIILKVWYRSLVQQVFTAWKEYFDISHGITRSKLERLIQVSTMLRLFSKSFAN